MGGEREAVSSRDHCQDSAARPSNETYSIGMAGRKIEGVVGEAVYITRRGVAWKLRIRAQAFRESESELKLIESWP